MSNHESEGGFEIKFTDREVSAWGGMALMKRMLDQMGFQQVASGWDLPPPGSNRGYSPVQLIEQWVVSIWCGACRFAHTETVRFDGTLTRLFGWTMPRRIVVVRQSTKRKLASEYRKQYPDPLRAPTTTGLVHGFVEQCRTSACHSCGRVKGLMDNLG